MEKYKTSTVTNDFWKQAKQKYQGMLETQKSGNKTRQDNKTLIQKTIN